MIAVLALFRGAWIENEIKILHGNSPEDARMISAKMLRKSKIRSQKKPRIYLVRVPELNNFVFLYLTIPGEYQLPTLYTLYTSHPVLGSGRILWDYRTSKPRDKSGCRSGNGCMYAYYLSVIFIPPGKPEASVYPGMKTWVFHTEGNAQVQPVAKRSLIH